MPVTLRCQRGHEWQTTVGGSQACPTCSALALTGAWDTKGSTGFGDQPTVTRAGVEPPIPLPAIPGYEVLGILGRGGMGIVYKARQPKLDRIVAIKMILGGHRFDPGSLRRFVEEAKALASLQHPNIVPIYEIGEHEGAPYFAMEHVEGGSLSRQLGETPLPALQAAELVETLARAMHAVHARGIVHRDLKPANILLQNPKAEIRNPKEERVDSDFGFRISDLTPKVTDFGLARRIEKGEAASSTGAVVGTPSFMAPEQAMGSMGRIEPRTDVYALGGILYACLTGRPPFTGETLTDTVLQVLSDEPVAPRTLNPKVPRDLETICLKCLRKEQQRRYDSAEALADDLQRFREGRPILARPAGPAERLAKWARRHPAIAALSAALAVVTLVALGIVSWQLHETQTALSRETEALENETEALHTADQEKRAAEESARSEALAKQQAQRDRDRADRISYYRTVALGFREWEDNQMLQARSRLEQCPPALRGWEYHALDRLCNKELLTLRPHRSPFNQLALSPDGRLIAGANWDSLVLVWDAQTGRELHRFLGHTNSVNALAFSPDGKHIASVGPGRTLDSGELRVWDVARGVHLYQQQFTGGVATAAAYSPDSGLLAVGMSTRQIHLLKPLTGEAIRVLDDQQGGGMALSFSPDSHRLASTGSSNVVNVWDVATGKLHSSFLSRPGGSFRAVAYSPDGQRLATAGHGQAQGQLWVWDVSGPPRQQEDRPAVVVEVPETPGPLANPVQSFKCVAWDRDGKRLAVGTHAGRVIILDAAAGRELRRLEGHGDVVATAAFMPEGREIVSASWDGTVQARDIDSGKHRLSLEGAYVWVSCVAFSPDGRHFATGGQKINVWGELAIRETDTGRLVLSRKKHGSTVLSVAYSPDGRLIATGSADQTVIVWDAQTGKDLLTFRNHRANVRHVAFASDSRQVASASDDGTVLLWEADSGTVRKTFSAGSGLVTALAVQPHGPWVAAATPLGGVKIWDTTTGSLVADLTSSSDSFSSLAWTADGKVLAIGSGQRVYLWDAVQKKALPEPLQEGAGRSIAFSPDGKFVLLGGDTLRLWDRAGKTVLRFRGHTEPLMGVAFHPDGKRFASCGFDRTVRLWHRTLSQPSLMLPETTGPFAVSPDGRHLASAGRERGITLWDLTTGERLAALEGHQHPVFALGFDASGQRLVSAASGKEALKTEVKLWDVDARKGISSFEAEGTVRGLVGNADRIILAQPGGSLATYDPVTGKRLQPMAGLPMKVGMVAFSPDGSLAAVLVEFAVWVIDTRTGKELCRLEQHATPVSAVAWDATGRLLLTATRGKADTEGDRPAQLKLWDITSDEGRTPGRLLHDLRGHNAGIVDVAFSPDGRRVVSAGKDDTMKLWDAESGQEVLSLRVRADRVRFDLRGHRLIAGTSGGVQVWDGSPR